MRRCRPFSFRLISRFSNNVIETCRVDNSKPLSSYGHCALTSHAIKLRKILTPSALSLKPAGCANAQICTTGPILWILSQLATVF